MQVFPLEVVRRRMQTMAAGSLSRKAGMVVLRQAVHDIWARERLKGFYAGMLPNTIQVDARLTHFPPRLSFQGGPAEGQNIKWTGACLDVYGRLLQCLQGHENFGMSAVQTEQCIHCCEYTTHMCPAGCRTIETVLCVLLWYHVNGLA